MSERNRTEPNAGRAPDPVRSTVLCTRNQAGPRSLAARAGAGVPFTLLMPCRSSLRQEVLPTCGICWRSQSLRFALGS